MLAQAALFHSFPASNIPLCVCVCVCMCVIFLASGRLGGIWVLAIVGSDAMNVGVQVSFQITAFSGYMPKRGIARS